MFGTGFIINVYLIIKSQYNIIKSRYQEKAALPTSVPMLPTEINGHSKEDFHVFKK